MRVARGRLVPQFVTLVAALGLGHARPASAQGGAAAPAAAADETALGELLITGERTEHVTRLAILPSLSPDLEDVLVRGVVRRDFELSGMFDVIADNQAPEGLYGFDDPVDLRAWQRIGAEVIIKLNARREASGKVTIFGLCYFLSHGREPVYQKTLTVEASAVRAMAHRITDALLGAITGRNGGFFSHLAFTAPYGRNPAVYTIDADGHDIQARTAPTDTSMAPFFGPGGQVYYSRSRDYSRFMLIAGSGERADAVALPFDRSIFAGAFSAGHRRLALAVGTEEGSTIFAGEFGGPLYLRYSATPVATHPAFSPSGQLAWVGGDADQGPQRVYVDGRTASPPGFSASAPTFCDTEDGVRLVYSVSVGSGRDLVLSDTHGKNLVRLTQNEGSNSYPACSPDGRLLAYFSERKGDRGLYIKSLKSGKTQKISGKTGQSLRWSARPVPAGQAP